MASNDDPYDREHFAPANKLERALLRAHGDPTRRSDLWRALWREQVHFLMPYHPEMEGVAQIREGEELPVISWSDKRGPYVPIFTAIERVPLDHEAGERPFCLGAMPGEVLFRFLAAMNLRVILNATRHPRIVIQPEIVAAFARGDMTSGEPSVISSLAAAHTHSMEETLLRPALPEHFPGLATAVRTHCDTRPVLAGAYLFHPVDASTGEIDTDDLRLVLWAKRRDDRFFQDLGNAARGSEPPVSRLSIGVVDHSNADGIAYLQRCKPLWPVLEEI